MRSAAAYINKIRVETTVKNNKVEYPGKVAKNVEPLAPGCPVDPNFAVLDYVEIPIGCNSRKKTGCIEPPPPVITYPLVYFIQDPNLYPFDPGAGNFVSVVTIPPEYEFTISKITSNGNNVNTQLANIPLGTVITIIKTSDPSVFFTVSLTTKLDKITYWLFTVDLLTFPVGSITVGDNVTFTYV